MKRASFTTALILAFFAIFLVLANAYGLVILIISTEPGHHIADGEIMARDGIKKMVNLDGEAFGAFIPTQDQNISFKVKVDGKSHSISFGYATPGEFQVNHVQVSDSGNFAVKRHFLP